MEIGKLYKLSSNYLTSDSGLTVWRKPCVYLGPAPFVREDGVVVPNHKFLISDGIRIVDQSLLRLLTEVES